MPVPVFIDEIFCWDLSNGSEPLRAVRRHPDKVSRGHWIPFVVEPVDAASLEHEQAVLHEVHLDHTQTSTRLVAHRVYCEIEGHRVRQKRAYKKIAVAHQRLRLDRWLASYEQRRRRSICNRAVSLLDHCDARHLRRMDAMRGILRDVSIVILNESVRIRPALKRDPTVEHIHETLSLSGPHRTICFEFDGVLGKSSAQSRRSV